MAAHTVILIFIPTTTIKMFFSCYRYVQRLLMPLLCICNQSCEYYKPYKLYEGQSYKEGGIR